MVLRDTVSLSAAIVSEKVVTDAFLQDEDCDQVPDAGFDGHLGSGSRGMAHETAICQML